MAQALDLSRRFFADHGLPLLQRHCPDLMPRIAAGLIGFGSEVLGHDDDLSRDHTWGPRFIIFMLNDSTADERDRIYDMLHAELPATYEGFCTRFRVDDGVLFPDPQGFPQTPVTTLMRYTQVNLGLETLPPPDDLTWLALPEQRLLEFTRGELFRDPTGALAAARSSVAYLPDSVWRYKLAYAWKALGHYGGLFERLGRRGDELSLRVAAAGAWQAAIRMAFLLNRRYAPLYFKRIHREFVSLPAIAGELEPLLRAGYTASAWQELVTVGKQVCELLYQHTVKCIDLPDLPPLYGVSPRYLGSLPLQWGAIAETIHRSAGSPLAGLPLDGAVDQWAAGPDLLLWPNRLRPLLEVYRVEPHPRESLSDNLI